jgi:alkaline phosphatase D
MTAEPFLHGVASGDPTPDAVVLWTRVEAAGPVDWWLATDEAGTAVVASGSLVAEPDHDLTAKVDVGGLEPATTYWYGFVADGTRSPTGRTRTLPGDGADHVRFAFTSCAKFNAGFFNAYDRIADRADLDFLLHLGDYIYEASNTPPATQTPGADIGRPFDPLHECITLDDYRTRYRQYHRDPSVQHVHATLPFICAADDHELADGAWRGGATEHKPEYGPWNERLTNAFRARREWLPTRDPDPADPDRVHRSIAIGDLLDLFIVDTRSRRDEPKAGDACHDPDRSALGADQRAWLFDGLRTSTARWRVLGNPSVFSSLFHPDLEPDLLEPLQKLKLIDPTTGERDHDQWDGYLAERGALVDLITTIGDTVVLSADVHVSLVAQVREDPWGPLTDDAPVAVELVSPSITSQNLDDKLGYDRGGSIDAQDRFVASHPHVQWCDFDCHGYVVVDLDADRLAASFWAVDAVLERTDDEHCIAEFTVAHGADNRAVGGPVSA